MKGVYSSQHLKLCSRKKKQAQCSAISTNNQPIPYHLSRYALCRIFLLLSLYDNASMFIHIDIFFYVRHNIIHSFALSLHFPLKLMTNHDCL